MQAGARLLFAHALLPEGWARDVAINVGPDGSILAVETGVRAAAYDGAVALPGLPNVHSHAFQRGMAGLTEIRSGSDDSFWTWRRVMYGFLERLGPAEVEAIAALAYVEMLESGFTAVGEFHYLHHAPDGRPYANVAELAQRIVAAAATTGIGLTLLPTLYMNGGFGGQPPDPAQRRFVNSLDGFLALAEASRGLMAGDAVLGVAAHSLRAVPPAALDALLAAFPDGPIHIHAAEQSREVAGCLAWSGRRPVEWLLDHVALGPRWCLIHATHTTVSELKRLAQSGAAVGLCPITEANLGDGLFDAVSYRAFAGRFGIGSDSHVRISAADELRTLEYGQRLRDQARNRLAEPGRSVGRSLCDAALSGGGQALGRPIGALARGFRADVVALDAKHAALMGREGDAWLDGWIFSGDNACVRDVWVGGRRVVAEGRHVSRDAVAARYAAALAALAGENGTIRMS